MTGRDPLVTRTTPHYHSVGSSTFNGAMRHRVVVPTTSAFPEHCSLLWGHVRCPSSTVYTCVMCHSHSHSHTHSTCRPALYLLLHAPLPTTRGPRAPGQRSTVVPAPAPRSLYLSLTRTPRPRPATRDPRPGDGTQPDKPNV